MRYQGKLAAWDEAKGFGFIEWNGGSDKVFVHISSFAARNRRPSLGDIVTYEVTKGPDGRHKAINVGFAGAPLPTKDRRVSTSRFPWLQGLAVIAIAAVAVGAYLRNDPRSDVVDEPIAFESPPLASSYRCAGKTHCSEMTSCDEAVFYIRNCPGTEMDGDGDGVPCEQQWCGY